MTTSDIRDIIRAQLLNHKQRLFEASLSRIMQHVQDAKKQSFAILTSWRQSVDKPTNIGNFQALKSFVRQQGLGFIQLRGHWQECQDPDVKYDQCPPEAITDSVEPSLMVMGINLKTARDLGEQYNQDAVVYAGPETQGTTVLFFKDGSTKTLGSFSPMAIGQAFSEFRSKEDKDKPLGKVARFFKFEGYSYPAQTYIEKLIEQQLMKDIQNLQEGLVSSYSLLK